MCLVVVYGFVNHISEVKDKDECLDYGGFLKPKKEEFHSRHIEFPMPTHVGSIINSSLPPHCRGIH